MTLDIVRVGTLREAAGIVAAEPGARLMGGGTLLMRAVNAGENAFERLILADDPDLHRIEIDGERVALGAAVTMTSVARHPQLAFVRPVAESIGGPAVRAMATVGGNLFAGYPFGDFTVALLALDAELLTEGADRAATMRVEDVLRDPSPPPFIIRSIAFRRPPEGSFRFVKAVRRRPHGAPVLTIAAVLPVVDGKIAGARIALGAMADRPIRARRAEERLEGRTLGDEVIAHAADAAIDGCTPRDDAVASAWYRMAVLPVHLKRLLSA